MLGLMEIRLVNRITIKNIGKVSLIENKGLNFNLSVIDKVPEGLDEPFSCKRIKWIVTITTIIKGRRKCKEKNRLRVGLETEGPPQIQVTKSFPTTGIADRTPVITVAPQKDICPHGRTYPKKAVPITIKRIITPEIHTFFWFLGEL